MEQNKSKKSTAKAAEKLDKTSDNQAAKSPGAARATGAAATCLKARSGQSSHTVDAPSNSKSALASDRVQEERIDRLEKLMETISKNQQAMLSMQAKNQACQGDQDMEIDPPLDYHYEYNPDDAEGDDFDMSAGPCGSRAAKHATEMGELPPLAAKFAAPTGVGAPLSDELADSLDFMIRHKLGKQTIEDTGNKYGPPRNCAALDAPRVNPRVWEGLRISAKANDTRLQKVQLAIAKGMTAVAHALEGNEESDRSETLNDALALLAHGHYELNMARKESMRPDINPKLSHLIKDPVQHTKWLFGEELSKQVKELQEEQKMTAGVVRFKDKGSAFRQERSRPYPTPSQTDRYRAAGWTKSSNHFLGKGPRPQTQPWWRTQDRASSSRAPHTQSRPPPSQQGKGQNKTRKSH